MNLFIDTASSKICLLLFKRSYIAKRIVDVHDQHVDKSFKIFIDFLNNEKCSVNDLEEIYFTNGPGKYIGTRVALIIVKIIMLYVKSVRLFVANSLHFASGFGILSSTSSLIVSKNNNYIYSKSRGIKIFNKSVEIKNHNYLYIDKLLDRFDLYKHYFNETNEILTATEF